MCSLYTRADGDERFRLLDRVFALGDPPAAAAGLSPDEFEAFVRVYGDKAAAEALTVVARLETTGEMVGALLAEDSATPPPEGLAGISAKCDPIFDILGQLDAEYTAGRTRTPGESLHLFLLGVSPPFAGRGIAQRRVTDAVACGLRKGYRVAVTEATNKRSQHVFRKQGFVERVRRSYRDHRFNGTAVFACIADQGGPMLMDKALG